MLSPCVRWMIQRDMLEVLDIENRSFEFPWDKDYFVRCLRQRNCIGRVADRDGVVAGYMVYELFRDRLHVLNFAVHPGCFRQGVGRAMVRWLFGALSPCHRSRIILEVRETNLPAQLFWRAMGFRAVRIEHGFYDETDEDAIVFQYRLANTERSDHEPVRRSRLS